MGCPMGYPVGHPPNYFFFDKNQKIVNIRKNKLKVNFLLIYQLLIFIYIDYFNYVVKQKHKTN